MNANTLSKLETGRPSSFLKWTNMNRLMEMSTVNIFTSISISFYASLDMVIIMLLPIRSGAFVLTVLARLTFWKLNNIKDLLWWFSGTPCIGTQENRSDNSSLAISSQSITGVVSQFIQAYAGRLWAHAQLEKTRHSIVMMGGGSAWYSKTSC
jgi:hypothetical protein